MLDSMAPAQKGVSPKGAPIRQSANRLLPPGAQQTQQHAKRAGGNSFYSNVVGEQQSLLYGDEDTEDSFPGTLLTDNAGFDRQREEQNRRAPKTRGGGKGGKLQQQDT